MTRRERNESKKEKERKGRERNEKEKDQKGRGEERKEKGTIMKMNKEPIRIALGTLGDQSCMVVGAFWTPGEPLGARSWKVSEGKQREGELPCKKRERTTHKG